MNILVGADPEVFAKRNGSWLSAFGLIPGTKEAPHKVKDGAVQVDGMALEFNIDPANTEDVFVHNIQSVMAQLADMVEDVELVAEPVARFGYDYIKSQPEEARDLGCNPDYNAWAGGCANDKPNVDLPFRTGAGHVHIGWTQGEDVSNFAHVHSCIAVIKQMDFFLGLPSIIFDKEVERRSMYGKAGAFRPKSYGAEYRVLSNKWVGDEKLMRWVFRATQAGMNALVEGRFMEAKYGDISHIINNSDVEAALSIINAEGIEVPC